ncbi:MAG: ATP phosphoribosyltransferase regulatory subunit [Thermomicrobiales bacterium]
MIDRSTTAGLSQPVDRPRGTYDRLPDDWEPLRRLEDELSRLVARHGYRRMDTPVIEHAELFARKLGGERLAQTYQFSFRGRDLALRPEHTASVMRAFVDTMQSDPLPVRLSYGGPVFRYESPQAGRSRQFFEFGCELIGVDGLLADAETILLALSCVRAAGVEQPTLVLGHIGVVLGFLDQLSLDHRTQDWLIWSMERIRRGEADATVIPSHLIPESDGLTESVSIDSLDRTAVVELLRQSGVDFESGSRTAEEIVDGLFDKGRRGADRTVLEGAVAFVEALIQAAGPPESSIPRLRELVQQRNLDTGPIDELSEVTRIVEASGFEAANIRIDLGLGRGLRYYTGMLFEVYAGPDAGLQIAGGGRYDDLARQLGARNQVPSGGFSIGLDRLLFSGNLPDSPDTEHRILVLPGEDAATTFQFASELREEGWRAVIDTRGRSENSARRWATRNGYEAVATHIEGRRRFVRLSDGREIDADENISPERMGNL